MRQDKRLYQWRAMAGETADDMMGELTHAAWSALKTAPGQASLDPHRWTELCGYFRDVFKGRLVHYKGCGEREECRISLASAADGSPFPAEEWGLGTPVLTLELGRDAGRLSRLLAALACRRLGIQREARRAAVLGAAEALGKIFARRLYGSDACATCSARKGMRERRLWPENVFKGACHDENLKDPGGD